jgi:hypothetical protein
MRSSSEKKPREVFLKDLAGFLGGSMEPIEGDPDGQSFRITFRYKDQDFVYEDFETRGFKDKVYKGYLKTKVPDDFSLVFSEKRHASRIRMDIFMASEVSTLNTSESVNLQIPKSLEGLKVTTNNPSEANRFFRDHKTSAVFQKYKNIDNRGYSSIAIGIIKGEIILEFSSSRASYPNVFGLKFDMHSIDDHLERVMTLVHKLKGES